VCGGRWRRRPVRRSAPGACSASRWGRGVLLGVARALGPRTARSQLPVGSPGIGGSPPNGSWRIEAGPGVAPSRAGRRLLVPGSLPLRRQPTLPPLRPEVAFGNSSSAPSRGGLLVRRPRRVNRWRRPTLPPLMPSRLFAGSRRARGGGAGRLRVLRKREALWAGGGVVTASLVMVSSLVAATGSVARPSAAFGGEGRLLVVGLAALGVVARERLIVGGSGGGVVTAKLAAASSLVVS